MEKNVNLKKVRHGLLISMLTVSVSFAGGLQSATATDPQQANPGETRVSQSTATVEEQSEKTAHTAKGAAAMRIYMDPKTGEIGVPPPGLLPPEMPESFMNAFSVSSEGLEVTKSPTPKGGVMIDLKGRFRSPLTVTQDAKGKLSGQHLPSVSDSGKEE